MAIEKQYSRKITNVIDRMFISGKDHAFPKEVKVLKGQELANDDVYKKLIETKLIIPYEKDVMVCVPGSCIDVYKVSSYDSPYTSKMPGVAIILFHKEWITIYSYDYSEWMIYDRIVTKGNDVIMTYIPAPKNKSHNGEFFIKLVEIINDKNRKLIIEMMPPLVR